MPVKDQLKKIHTLGAFTLAGITSALIGNTIFIKPTPPAPMHQSVKTNAQKDNKETKISTSFGSIYYKTVGDRVVPKSCLRINPTDITPPLYYIAGIKQYKCGPVEDYEEGHVRREVKDWLRKVVENESIAQNLKQKEKIQNLNQTEKNFIEFHKREMTEWGLTSRISKNGEIEIIQKNPAFSGKLTFSQEPYQSARSAVLTRKLFENTR